MIILRNSGRWDNMATSYMCKCYNCHKYFKSPVQHTKFCNLKDCKIARRKYAAEYQKEWRSRNKDKVTVERVRKSNTVKSLKRERHYSNEPCICGCGKLRKQNRWYSPECYKYQTSSEVLGGLSRHNGQIVMGGYR
jgi:hypothetical protein